MISLREQLIILNGKTEGIEKFDVWFQSPFGMHDNLAEAIQVCLSRDLDPEITLRPRVVVIGDSGSYEVVQ